MEKSFIRRTAAGILALSVICSAASCGKKKDETSTKAPEKASEVMTNAFKAQPLETDVEFDYVQKMSSLGDGQVLIEGDDTNGEIVYYVGSSDLSDLQQIASDVTKIDPDIEGHVSTAVSAGGNIYALKTETDYGDAEKPDFDDPEFDYDSFDFEAYRAAATYTYTLYQIDKSGEVLSEKVIDKAELDKIKGDSEEEVSIGDIYAAGDKLFCISYGEEPALFPIDPADGTVGDKISMDEDYVASITELPTGEIICMTFGMRGPELKKLDIEKGEVTDFEVKLDDNAASDIQSILPGSGDYMLLLYGSESLTGIKEDGTAEELINWADSDINGQYVSSVITLPDNEYLIYMNDYTSDTKGFYKLTQRDVSELENTTMIKVAVMWNDTSVSAKVNEFNQSQSDYRVKLVNYSKYDEYNEEEDKMDNSAEKQLKMDIVSGNVPDMIITYDRSIITSLANKDIYEDLTPYLEKDSELSTDDILPNIINACTINKKLLMLTPSFSMITYAAKTKNVDKQGWTFDDMIEAHKAHPDMQLMDIMQNKEDVLEVLLMTSSKFVDFEKSTCHFDDPDFVKILEFCNEFPGEEESFKWDTATDEEIQTYMDEQQTMCRNDKALLSVIDLSDFRGYKRAKVGTFGEDITLVGTPGAGGTGGVMQLNSAIAILSSSPSKDACWEFMKSFFDEEYQTTSENFQYELPSLKAAFEKKADEAMSKPYYLDEKGKKVEYDDMSYIGDKEIKIDPLTQEERDFICDYITGSTDVVGDYPEDIVNILREEVLKYFNGECSAQDAADVIQNRVSILISEQE